MGQIAQAFERAARRVGKGLAEDFSNAYHGILKDTEHKAGQVAEHAAENEARTAADLAKAAEKDAHAPHVGEPHGGDHGGVPGPRDGGRGRGPSGRPGRGRDQVKDPHEAGRGPFTICEGGEPVDMATGRMFMNQVDVELPAAMPLEFTRSFESGYQAGTWMGPRWICPFDERLELDDEGVVHLAADRTAQAYPHPEPGDPVQSPAGTAIRELAVDVHTGRYTLTDRSEGTVREFTPFAGTPEALLTCVRDGQGGRIDLAYDQDGAPSSISHSGGYRLLATVDSGRITALRLAGAGEDGHDQLLVRYGYQDGHLVTVYDSAGRATRYVNDAAGRVVSWRDRAGTEYRYVYDESGRVVDESGPEGLLRFRFEYGDVDPATGSRTHCEIDAYGNTTRFEVNDRAQITARTDALGHTTRFERDDHDRLLSQTDPLGRTTRYAYDGAGDLVSVTGPDGRVSTLSYAGDLSVPTEIVYPGGAAWRQEFDDSGRRISLTDPAGGVTRYGWDDNGHLASSTDALGHTTRLDCDAAGLPVAVTDPTGAVIRYERDAFGRVTAETDPLGTTVRYTWDTEGRLTTRRTGAGPVETFAYDDEGNLLVYTDQLGQVSSFEYGPFSVLTARTSADGSRLAFDYDANLRLTRVTDALGRQWTYSYDAAGRLVGERDFQGRAVRYLLDGAGQTVTVTNALGQEIHYGYDQVGNTVLRDAAGRITTFAYDAAGNLVRATNPDADLVRTVDDLGNVLSESVNGRTVSCTWDALGQRLTRTTPAGHASSWAYDPAGQATALCTPLGRIDFVHDIAGRERRRTVAGRLVLESSWDERHRLLGEVLRSDVPGESRVLNERSYRYRDDGRLTAVSDSLSGPRAFDLDRLGRVTSVRAATWTESYAYDAAGNLTSADWPATERGRAAVGQRTYQDGLLTGAGRVRYEYDAVGRITVRRVTRLSRKPDTWQYTWDAEDHLVQVTTPDGACWRYRYDPFGRRIAKQRLSADGSAVEEQTDFTWDGHILAEQTTRAAYLPGPYTLTWDHNGAQPVSQSETITRAPAPGTREETDRDETDRRFFAIVTDLVGTPTELVDPATGTVAWRTTPTLWGHTTWPATSATYTPLRFPGQYYDPETHLHYNVLRYYDPETARYTSPDPLGLAPSPNPDAYVPNPHSSSDPLGLSAVDESDPSWGGRVVYKKLDRLGRARGVEALLSSDMMGGKTDPKVDPAGWVTGQGYNRAHLLGAQLGGSNKDPRNFVTMHQYANTPVMRDLEGQVRKAVDNGEIIRYRVTPVYSGRSLLPKGVTIEAYGNKGFKFQPKGSVGGTNVISICNKKRK
ncbi:DNA/RNA non-specific endonuclease [Streptacidiphilus jiangxiensis]|uniref:RHS repeat-associated core domain-containing protein n=1 Tax=Streptacidiphilus jiangxiensis TaxID=235985 RepID=A0A1H7V201_STRJI|nr:DNA/RNA non-specific endonuclease [Streptacidiphilus jiangxiensis]SEM02865.1 RHS repeat-associated core domain-containing protein [Streptacidiphilus jiangxiensis]